MAQPEVAGLLTRDKLIAGAGGQGLINRFLTVAPETAAGTRMFRDAPPEAAATLAGFAQRVRDLLARPPAMKAGARNELAPRPLPLSAAARREWIAFQQATERALAPGGPLEPVRGLANKLPEHATRLAAVLTLLVDPDAAEVSGTAMGSGIVLAQHYAGEALRLAEASGVSADLLLAERVRLWLLHDWPEPYVSLPDLYQRGPRAVRTQEAARRAVATLEAHEHLLREPGGATIGGQPRREAWLIVGRSAP
jgi:hypothetical protein